MPDHAVSPQGGTTPRPDPAPACTDCGAAAGRPCEPYCPATLGIEPAEVTGPEHLDPDPAALPPWQADRLATLLDALGDVPISEAERRSLAWLAGFEPDTVANVAAVIRRTRQAER